jgi:hypothetical protein
MGKAPSPNRYSRDYMEAVITGSHVIYADARLAVLSIENSWAAAFWSEGTSWCIAEGSCYADYRKMGRLYLFRLLNERRNYLLSPANCEFRNSRNRRLCPASFIIRFPRVEPTIRSIIRADWKASFFFGMVEDDARFEHSLNLRELGISMLPNGLSVRDDLVLRGNPIRMLPQNLIVGGDLDIRGTEIDEIPLYTQILGRIISDYDLTTP